MGGRPRRRALNPAEAVKKPMGELLAELEPGFGEGKIFRPYRDVRFSKDKTPEDQHRRHHGQGRLAKYRAAIDGDTTGRRLERTIAKLEAAGLEVTAHERLKAAPQGYPSDHQRIELLRMKGCIASQSSDVDAWFETPAPRTGSCGYPRRRSH